MNQSQKYREAHWTPWGRRAKESYSFDFLSMNTDKSTKACRAQGRESPDMNPKSLGSGMQTRPYAKTWVGLPPCHGSIVRQNINP